MLCSNYTIRLSFPQTLACPVNFTQQTLLVDDSLINIGQWLMTHFPLAASIMNKTLRRHNKCIRKYTSYRNKEGCMLVGQNNKYYFAYFSDIINMYVYCGKFGYNLDKAFIHISELSTTEILIKCRKTIRQSISTMVDGMCVTSQRPVQSKMRTIEEILTLVYHWRNKKSTNDSYIETGQGLSIPKKTLDEYLPKIVAAYEYGYNFEAHKHETISQLNKYIAECKNIENSFKSKDNVIT